jgi:hypothetical protein
MSARKPYVVLAVLNLLGYLGVIIVNSLANILPINGKYTGDISDSYTNLFTPAGLTFSVWGVIYVLLAVFSIYQLYLAFKGGDRGNAILSRIGIWFLISCAANIGWIFAWHYDMIGYSLLIMFVLLISLIILYLRLQVGKNNADNAEKFMAYLPFSIYLGWITIATIANVTVFLVDIGWGAFGLRDQFWTILVIAVGVVITLCFIFMRKDIFYGLVVDWALIGILIKRMSDDSAADQWVFAAAIAAVAVVSIGIIIQLLRRRIYA